MYAAFYDFMAPQDEYYASDEFGPPIRQDHPVELRARGHNSPNSDVEYGPLAPYHWNQLAPRIDRGSILREDQRGRFRECIDGCEEIIPQKVLEYNEDSCYGYNYDCTPTHLPESSHRALPSYYDKEHRQGRDIRRQRYRGYQDEPQVNYHRQYPPHVENNVEQSDRNFPDRRTRLDQRVEHIGRDVVYDNGNEADIEDNDYAGTSNYERPIERIRPTEEHWNRPIPILHHQAAGEMMCLSRFR
jgi:hypothetical protein